MQVMPIGAVEPTATPQETTDPVVKQEVSEPLAESTPAEPEAKPEDGSDVDEILNKKDNIQKRIDKEVAKRKALEDENKYLRELMQQKSKPEEKSDDSDTKEYTREQLQRAFLKAHNEGDAELMFEVFNHMMTSTDKKLRSDYESQQKKMIETQQKIQEEWSNVVTEYSDLADDTIYPGARKDLNLKDANSLLYRTATQLYTANDPELRKLYQKEGGQRLAVADALNYILKDKRSKGLFNKVKDTPKPSLVGSDSAIKDDAKPVVPKSREQLIDDYIDERRKQKNKFTIK